MNCVTYSNQEPMRGEKQCSHGNEVLLEAAAAAVLVWAAAPQTHTENRHWSLFHPQRRKVLITLTSSFIPKGTHKIGNCERSLKWEHVGQEGMNPRFFKCVKFKLIQTQIKTWPQWHRHHYTHAWIMHKLQELKVRSGVKNETSWTVQQMNQQLL